MLGEISGVEGGEFSQMCCLELEPEHGKQGYSI